MNIIINEQSNQEELSKLLTYKKFKFKNKNYKCTRVKKQLQKIVISTDKYTLILLPSELLLITEIEPIEEGVNYSEEKYETFKHIKKHIRKGRVGRRPGRDSFVDVVSNMNWLRENSKNHTVSEMAKKFFVTPQTIYNNLSDLGLEFKRRKAPKTKQK